MKTAISIPDAVFEEAERVAQRHGLSRSELYTRAIAEYLEGHRFLGVRERLDAVYGVDPAQSDLSRACEASVRIPVRGRLVIRRGEIWWASLPDAAGSAPGFRRPVLVVQANGFNDSAIRTVICAVVTANLRLGEAPGNVRLGRRASGLSKESVVNVSQLITLDKRFLTERVSLLAPTVLRNVDAGVRLALAL